MFALKDAVYELVADAAELVPEYLAFSRMIDDLGLHTFETYAAAREQIIADQADAMLELSTPVIKLWEGVIAVPLVGTLDSARTQLVMEKLLETLVATGADHAVLDITGVSYWAICVAALFEWEASAYKDNSLPWHPSLTDLINPLLGPHPIKSAAFLLWVLVGWALVRR